MTKLCEHCGNRNNGFSGEPLYLGNEKILCCACADYIRNDFNKAYYITSQDEYNILKSKVIETSKNHFNEQVTNLISERLDYINPTQREKIEESLKATSPTTSSSSGIFNNIASKIKGLAYISTILGIIISVICGLTMILSGEDALVFTGIIIAILGCLLSWISSFILYGFGQLVENSDNLLALSKKSSQE